MALISTAFKNVKHNIIPFVWLYLRTEKKEAAAEKRSNSNGVRDVIRQQYKELGPMDFHQLGVLVLFVILIFLWFFRKPQFMTGWSDFFHTKWVNYWLPYLKNGRNCTIERAELAKANAAATAAQKGS